MNTGTDRLPQSIIMQGQAADELLRQHAKPLVTDTEDILDPKDLPAEGDTAGANTDNKPKTDTEDPPAQAKDDSWEQKYKILKGKYDAEVPRLWGQNRTAQDKIASLEATVKDLEDRQKAAPPQAGSEASWNPDDYSEYGEEFVTLAKQNQELTTQLAELKTQLQSVTGEIAQTRQQTGWNGFIATIAEEVPGWKAQNDDSEFIGWLSNVESMTGKTYQEMLADAKDRHDGNRAAQIFLRFQTETGKRYAQGTPETPKGKIPAPTVALPKSRSGGAPPADMGGKIYTRAEITEFYNEVTKGKYSEEDRKRIEHDIFNAQRSGRIR